MFSYITLMQVLHCHLALNQQLIFTSDLVFFHLHFAYLANRKLVQSLFLVETKKVQKYLF